MFTKSPFIDFFHSVFAAAVKEVEKDSPNRDASVKTRHYRRISDSSLNVHLEDPELVEVVKCSGTLIVFSKKETEIVIEDGILKVMVFAPEGTVKIKNVSLTESSIIVAKTVIGEKDGYVESWMPFSINDIFTGKKRLPMISTAQFVDRGMKLSSVPVECHAKEWKTFGDCEHAFADHYRKRICANEITTAVFGLPINGGIMDLVRDEGDETMQKFVGMFTDIVEQLDQLRSDPKSVNPSQVASRIRAIVDKENPHHQEKDETRKHVQAPKEHEEDQGGTAPAPRRTAPRKGVTVVEETAERPQKPAGKKKGGAHSIVQEDPSSESENGVDVENLPPSDEQHDHEDKHDKGHDKGKGKHGKEEHHAKDDKDGEGSPSIQ